MVDIELISRKLSRLQGYVDERFQNMASFRNMLVHRYENFDEELVYGIFTKHLTDFDLYSNLIRQWVVSLPGFESG